MLGPSDFLGAWQLDRAITDNLAGQHGRLTGTASFVASVAGRLDYRETGTLRLDAGPQMAASRGYQWVFLPDRVDVAFDDGRAFHSFVPKGHAAGTDHPCGADFYTVRYDFTAWPKWSAAWTVTGPRKDYVSVSNYAPA
jgi:hypothetical protein